MPSDLFRRINLDLIEPNFLQILLNVIAECRKQGAEYVATQGFRTYAEQKQIWCQGRTQPGKIVTNAMPGESAHNFGLAVDFMRIDGHGQPDWNPKSYRCLGDEASKQELVWGGGFHSPDSPHVQVKGFVTKEDLAPVKTAFDNGGLNAAWVVVNGLKVV